MTVGVIARRSDDAVMIGLGERVTQEHMDAKDTGVQVAYRRGIVVCSHNPFSQVIYILVLLNYRKVLDRVDELGSAHLSQWDASKRQYFKLLPGRFHPHDHPVAQGDGPRENAEPVRGGKTLQCINMGLVSVKPQFPPLRATTWWFSLGSPQVG